MKTLVIGLECLSLTGLDKETAEHNYWERVRCAVVFFESLRSSWDKEKPLFEFVSSCYEVGRKDTLMNYGVTTWRRSLHGVLIFVRPARLNPFFNKRMEYDALSVQRLGMETKKREEDRLGPPVFVFAPITETPKSYSHVIIVVRPTRYRFGYFDGSTSAILRALEWLANKAEVVLASQIH